MTRVKKTNRHNKRNGYRPAPIMPGIHDSEMDRLLTKWGPMDDDEFIHDDIVDDMLEIIREKWVAIVRERLGDVSDYDRHSQPKAWMRRHINDLAYTIGTYVRKDLRRAAQSIHDTEFCPPKSPPKKTEEPKPGSYVGAAKEFLATRKQPSTNFHSLTLKFALVRVENNTHVHEYGRYQTLREAKVAMKRIYSPNDDKLLKRESGTWHEILQYETLIEAARLGWLFFAKVPDSNLVCRRAAYLLHNRKNWKNQPPVLKE